MEGTFLAEASAMHEAIVREAIGADRSAPARVRELARWILEDPVRAQGIEGLAARAAMSRRNLERLFVLVMGVAPSRYVERARVALASRLLAETHLPAKSIAARCGFGSEERMRRAFNRVVGASPRRYAAMSGSAPGSRYYS